MKTLLRIAAAAILFSIDAPAAAQEHAADYSGLTNRISAFNAKTEIGITRGALNVTEERVASLIAAHDFRTAFYFAADLPSLKRPRILLAP